VRDVVHGQFGVTQPAIRSHEIEAIERRRVALREFLPQRRGLLQKVQSLLGLLFRFGTSCSRSPGWSTTRHRPSPRYVSDHSTDLTITRKSDP